MRASRPPQGSLLTARVITGPLGFFVAGVLDVSAAWGRWGLQELAARLARRSTR
jgi:hypothetical protein